MGQPDNKIDLEARRTIKALLSDLETDLSDPIEFNKARKRVFRSIWDLVKLARQSGQATLTEEYACPDCGGVISVSRTL